MKVFIAAFLVLIFTIPAWGKTRQVYPVSCDDLWAAVKDTLGDHRNYGVAYMDDYAQRASFTVVGTLVMYTQKVTLEKAGNGCAMNAIFLQVGADDSEWRQFHKRVGRSLAGLQASKPRTTTAPPGE